MKKLKNKYAIIGLVVVVLLVVVLSVSGKDDAAFETAQVTFADVIQEIDVTGKIAPEEKADLSFENTGVLAYLGVKVGDAVVKGQVLGSLDSREARAAYQSAQANVLAEQARLDELEKGTRREELSISGTAYTNESRALINAAREAFAQIDDMLYDTVDTLFRNGDSYNPTLLLYVSNDTRKKEIESLRVSLKESLEKWNDTYMVANPTADQVAAFARETLTKTKSLIDRMSQYAKDSADKQTLSNAQVIFASLNKDYLAAQTLYDDARGDLVLKQAGSTSQSVQVQRAKTEQAIADAATKEAVLQKMTLIAPFDGVVTLVEPVVGETVSANTVAFSVMTAYRYKIEVFIPESNIGKVQIGNNATVRLDAYGDTASFTATVSKIDPAETIVEGIPTYKVTLSIAADPRIRSGMTADINIVTAEKRNVLTVPTRALIDRKGQIFVRVGSGDMYVEAPIVIGLKGSNGNTEVISGIEAGKNVRTN